MNWKLLGIPAVAAALVAASVAYRLVQTPSGLVRTPSGKVRDGNPRGKRDGEVPIRAQDSYPVTLEPERSIAQDERTIIVENVQVKMLVRRLRESAVQGDQATQRAMTLGLRKWKGARGVVEQELARARNPRETQALQNALRELK